MNLKSWRYSTTSARPIIELTSLEAPKIYRVPGTQAATGTSDLVTRNTKISACLNSNEQLIVYEADSLTWVPTRLDGRPYRPSEQILARIAKLTNCIIEPDEVSRGFRVRGDTDEHIHEAIKKLEVVDASEVRFPLHSKNPI